MENVKSELEEIAKLYNSVIIGNQDLTKEIDSLQHAADDVVILLYSRRCLEVILTDICENTLNRDRGTEPLKGIIDKLAKDKIIPPFIYTAMQNVNNNSTYGAHPKEFDKRQVRSTLIDLATVFDWYFFDHKKLEKKTASTKKNKEEGFSVKTPSQETKTKKEVYKKASPQKTNVKPLLITGFGIIAIAAGVSIYFLTNKKSDNPENNISQSTDTLAISTLKKDTSLIIETKKPENTETAEITAQPKTDKRETTVINTAKVLDLPNDLESALKILSDKSINFKERKATLPSFLKRFISNAKVEILKNGFYMEPKTIEDYLNSILSSGYLYQIKVTSEVKEGNKIKSIKVEHTDK